MPGDNREENFKGYMRVLPRQHRNHRLGKTTGSHVKEARHDQHRAIQHSHEGWALPMTEWKEDEKGSASSSTHEKKNHFVAGRWSLPMGVMRKSYDHEVT